MTPRRRSDGSQVSDIAYWRRCIESAQRSLLDLTESLGRHERGAQIRDFETGADYLADLRHRMEMVGITLSELAEEMGVHLAQVSRLFSGRVPNPYFNTIASAERAFGRLASRKRPRS